MYARFPKGRWAEIATAEKHTDEGNAAWSRLQEEFIESFFDEKAEVASAAKASRTPEPGLAGAVATQGWATAGHRHGGAKAIVFAISAKSGWIIHNECMIRQL